MSYDNNMEGGNQTSDWGYDPVTSSWDNLNIVAPSYNTFPTSTGYHHTMSVPRAYQNPTPQSFYSSSHLSTNTDIFHMFSVTSFTSTGTGSENLSDELQVSEEEFTQIKAEIIPYGLFLRTQWQRGANPSLVSHKWCGPPLGDPGPGATNQGDTAGRKKRKAKEGKETGVGQAAQRGETQAPPVEGTQNNQKQNPSGLDLETLVVPQGVSSLLVLGPTISGATPGSHEYTSQAWTDRTGAANDPQENVGTEEDAHDEEETDRERWERLMRHADGVWRCMISLWWAGLFRPVDAAAALQVHRASEATGLAKVPALSQKVSSPQ